MIKLTRNQSTIEVTITPNILNYSYTLKWNCSDDVHAELLRRRIDEEMEHRLNEIRKEAYLDGYKDGRGKKAKKSCFKSWW